MRDVNDDMDELFRRAADGYPLNTNSADWKKVHAAMGSSEAPLQHATKKNKAYRLLWLLLLLPFAFGISKYVLHHDNINKAEPGNVIKYDNSLSGQKNADPKKLYNKNLNGNKDAGLISMNKAQKSLSPNIFLENQIKAGTQDITVTYRKNNIAHKSQGGKSIMTIANADMNILTSESESQNANETKKNYDINEIDTNKIEGLSEFNSDLSFRNETKKVTNQKELISSDTTESNTIKKSSKTSTSKKEKENRFYAGIIVGPDLSSVKLQKINKSGFTFGIIAGYKFTRKLSIETGLLLDKKYYYSKGKYFNAKHLYLPSYRKIDNIDGNCNMLELPVNIKFDIKSNKKVQWFAVGGISSYFMKKEDYTYSYREYGLQMEKDVSFKESSNVWGSVLNLGLGYSHKMGKAGMLRIEPYVKIPFKGIGIGSLPITSSGIYLGFTKNLF